MIRILARLVAWTFLRNFLVFVVAGPPLFIIGHITENMDDYIDRSLTVAEVAQAYVFMLPMFVRWSFPFAALIGAVFTIHGMTTHHELVAAKAGGISFHRTIAPIVLVGLLLTGVALALTELEPRGNRIAAALLRNEDPRLSWRTDFVYRSEGGLTWQIARLSAVDGRMSTVIIERPPEDGSPGMHVLASGAVWDSVGGWTLQHGHLRTLAADSTERSMEFDRLIMRDVAEGPNELLEAPREPDEMTYAEIDRMAEILKRTGGNANELLVKREQKISLAVATLVVLLFGAPLATSNKRGGTAYGIGLSLGTVIVYILMLKIAGAVGEAGLITPLTAAWLPNFVFLAAALVLLARVRT
jgi:lipopolysaccharide export system permease protein